jgi:hypothetical protein
MGLAVRQPGMINLTLDCGRDFTTVRAPLTAALVAVALVVSGAMLTQADAKEAGPCVAVASSTVNVRDFGAKGDGQTDDTGAIRRAIAGLVTVLFCDASHDGKLFFPPGTYVVSGALSLPQSAASGNSISIEGEGSVATVIEATQNSGIFDFDLSRQVPVSIRGLALVADIAHAGAAVSVSMPAASRPDGPRSLLMEDVTIRGKEAGERYFDTGLMGSGLTKPLIEGVAIAGPAAPNPGGQSMYGTACVSLIGGWGAEIENPSACNNMAAGLRVKQRGGLVKIRSRNFGVGTRYGITIDAGGGAVDIEETHVNSAAGGIDISRASAVTLISNLFLNADATTDAGHGSIAVSDSSNVRITNNVLWQNARGANPNPNRTAISIGPHDRNVVVAGNIITEQGTGIAIASGVTGARILYNRLSGQAVPISDYGTRTDVRGLEQQSGGGIQ